MIIVVLLTYLVKNKAIKLLQNANLAKKVEHYKIGKEILTLDNIKIKKKKIHQKNPIVFGDLDIEKTISI